LQQSGPNQKVFLPRSRPGQTTNEMYALFGPAVQIIGRRLDGLIAGESA
jgi:hypothetical protein